MWLAAFVFTSAFAGDPPKIELGLGAAAALTPDYPGSDEQHLHGLPFPYFIYRGKILKSDRERGTRAELLARDQHTFDLSFGGGFPSPRDSNQARLGMEKLDWLGEVGPRYSVQLWTSSAELPSSLRFQLSWRGVFATDFSRLKDQGNMLEPQVSLQTFLGTKNQWRVICKVGLLFSDQRFASYFYEVTEKDVLPGRPRYEARPGLMSANLDFGMTYFWSDSLRILASQEFSFLSGSANQGSPLFRKTENQSFFMAFIWVLHVVDSLERKPDT